MSYLEKPWLKFYGHVPESVEYSRLTLYEKVKEAGTQYPNAVAWEFMNMSSTFKNFLNEVDHFANGLAALGFKKGGCNNYCNAYFSPSHSTDLCSE